MPHLVELIDLDRLVVNATVPSAEVYRLRPGQPVEVSERREADGAEAVDAPGRRGAIAFIGLEIDPKTDTVAVRSALPPGSGVRPGQLVNVRIITEERQGRLAVPVESVVTVDGTPVIALVAGDHATQRPVKLGLRDGELVEIEAEGLQEGMTVVTAGAYGLPRDTRVRVLLP
jgi:multidrug efflux pump subunit AcrA (membrane-fusion protein)